LSTFVGHGGKLLFYHGVSDPWFSALDTIEYYEKLAVNGGAAPLDDWSRLFLVPGMGHCSGGAAALDRFDLLTATTRPTPSSRPVPLFPAGAGRCARIRTPRTTPAAAILRTLRASSAAERPASRNVVSLTY
jgi:hypothetical protein